VGHRHLRAAAAAVVDGQTLYPTLFSNVNLIQATKDFYSKFYFYTLTDQQATQIVNATLTQ
jgi:hypothetical protein